MASRVRRAFVLSVVLLFAATAPLGAANPVVSAHTVPLGNWPNLAFPNEAEPFVRNESASKMFKPEGPGPFPGLVILPSCGGHAPWYHTFDWAKQALDRGYAVLVADPLTPRGVTIPGENCRSPAKVSLSRYRKDAVDAAEHLHKQPFVDRNRIALMGFSFGAMAGLGLSGDGYATLRGRQVFRAVVSFYPRCYLRNRTSPITGKLVDVRWVPQRVAVPLQVQMGELDTETPPTECLPLLQQQKARGAPIDFIVHKGATHVWDAAALGDRVFRKVDSLGVHVEYRYNPEITAESVKRAFDFLDRHVKGK